MERVEGPDSEGRPVALARPAHVSQAGLGKLTVFPDAREEIALKLAPDN